MICHKADEVINEIFESFANSYQTSIRDIEKK